MKTAHAVFIAVMAVLAAPASAQSGQAQTGATVAPVEDPKEAGPAADERRAELDAERDARRHCLRETGSQLRPRHTADRCSAYGNVWTREDLARTGHLDIANALRTLDVSIR